MTRILPFLRPSLRCKFRPTSPAASSAHLRWYSVLRPGESDSRTSDFQWRQQTPVSEHVSSQDRLYPRITSQAQAINGSHFRSRYSPLKQDEVNADEVVILRGRVSNQRSAGLKLRFLELQQQDGRPIQVVCNYARLEDQSSEQAYQDFLHSVRRGDIYSCKGSPYRTSRGELSLRITEIPKLLAPCQHPFPTTLSDPETKIRNRHLDLWINRRSAETFRLRSDIIQRIRQFLLASGHREIQTPILADEAGGAVARPFHTSATEFPGRRISLRTAPELWLKRLVLGGFERVFEIGPCFRNEGLDLNHNPEYTTCEFYQAYSNLEDLISTTETLFTTLATLTREQLSAAYRSLPPLTTDFTPPFPHLDFIPALETALQQPLPDLSAPTAATSLLSILQSHNIPPPTNPTLPRLLDHLSATYLEPQCAAPTFITHHPECLSPLSKSFPHPTTSQRVAARAELFVNKQELVNMYEEENSPFEQRRKFLEQLKHKTDDSNDEGEATRKRKHKEESGINESYLKALEWGLPPTGGWGCGVDRLCMLFSGAERISDVLAFGNLRNVLNITVVRLHTSTHTLTDFYEAVVVATQAEKRVDVFPIAMPNATQLAEAEKRVIKMEDVGDNQVGEAGKGDQREDVLEISDGRAGPAGDAGDDQHEGAATATVRTNPYAGLTNSGPRKRKAQQGNDASPDDHPHAPKPRKAKAKKTTASGKLVDTRTMQRYTRGDVVDLKYVIVLISSIENAVAAGNDVTKLVNKLRERLHQIEFNSNLCYQLIDDSKLLGDQGLPRIIGTTGTVQFPYDLIDDSHVLHQRWFKGLFDAHLLHGIELKNRILLEDTSFRSRNLEKEYAFKVSAHYVGAGELINGQWWPLQICMIRDGAHGEIEAGICGEPGKGVFSIVVGSGGYDNIDNGDVIQYCGTSGSNGKETGNTRLMMESLNRGNAVRVIRSGTANNKKKTVYQPTSGLRYDGLYEVTEDELLHAATAMHRFKLERLSGQHPIRYKGVEARPTPEERRSYESIRESLGLKG